jgi:hypothetical protein
VVDEDCFAAGIRARVNVPPAITGEVAAGQINPILSGSAHHQSRPWFPAIAAIRIVMKAREDVVNRQFLAETAVHEFDILARLTPSSHVGLIRYDDKKKILGLKTCELVRRTWKNAKVGYRGGGVRLSASYNHITQDTISIEKDSLS